MWRRWGEDYCAKDSACSWALEKASYSDGERGLGREAAATLMEGPGILTEVLHRYRGWGLGELAFR